MTTWERFKRAFEHRDADRVPITDDPWETTVRRWQREGMPAGTDWCDFFDIDKVAQINIDISPRFPETVIEETDRHIITTSPWGVTVKNFKNSQSTPENLDYRVTTPEEWAVAKSRMTLEDDRIPWDYLKANYDRWRAEGQWIRANFWFGFDVTHARMMGTETTLIAMVEEPEFVEDIFDTYLSRCEALYSRIWDAGYHFDQIFWWDDMGYKGTTFFSPNMYRSLLQPYHKRAVDWAHNHGIFAELHSCGDVMTLIPDIIATGVDALNPLEVKAGMDALGLKRDVGDRLVLHGGINAQQWSSTEAVIAEINEKIPALKENGGYIFSSDHSVPDDVSLEDMKRIIDAAQLEAGKAKAVKALVQQAVDEGVPAKDILKEGLMEGMNAVGDKFKRNEVFVPEVLMAARAMNQSLELLKPLLADSGLEPAGRACIGTVQGDLHDIGKSLVKIMLEGKGFEVIDLGTDVAPEAFVQTAREQCCDLICCSALLTTTMHVMEDVVKAAKEAGIRDKVKIMIGGAPVNEDFCRKIGADAYTVDAASAADKALALCRG